MQVVDRFPPKIMENIKYYNTIYLNLRYVMKCIDTDYLMDESYPIEYAFYTNVDGQKVNKSDVLVKIKEILDAYKKFKIELMPINAFESTKIYISMKNMYYNMWKDTIPIYENIYKKEEYNDQIVRNISNIRGMFKIATDISYSNEEIVDMINLTVLRVLSLSENESTVKSIIKLSCSKSKLKNIAQIYETKMRKQRSKSVNESKSFSFNTLEKLQKKENEYILDFDRVVSIKSIKIPDETKLQGGIKYISKTKEVIATNDFERGNLIEVAPVRTLNKIEYNYLIDNMVDKSVIFNIIPNKLWGIPLGYISLYAFTDEIGYANGYFRYYPKDSVIKVYALRDIEKGEEIVLKLV